MKIQVRFILLLAALAAASDPLFGCTVFTATKGGVTLVGNNEDWSDPDTKVWFLVPEEGRYGRVYFGFKNGWAQGGMNDQGLFFDWVAGFRDTDWKEDPDKKTVQGSLSELIMEKAANVDEAVAFYEIYNEKAFDKAKIFLVDRSGVSAAVGFEKGELKVHRQQGGVQVLGYGYKIASKMLEQPGAVEPDYFAKTLKNCQQHFRFPTQYSNVFDLKKGVVYLARFRKNKEIFRFDLKEELAKGNHYYDIPRIEEQLKKPLMKDGKTLDVVKVSPKILKDYVGLYRFPEGATFTVSLKDGILYGQASKMTPKAYRPASESKFFLTFWDQQITFLRDDNGRVAKMRVKTFDDENVGERVPQ